MRICKKCGVPKELNQFYTYKNGNTVHHRKICKACFNQREIDRYARNVNKKRIYRVNFCPNCQKWKEKYVNFSINPDKCNDCSKNEIETILATQNSNMIIDTKEEQSSEISLLKSNQQLCKWCNQVKDVTEFYKGSRSRCKKCHNELDAHVDRERRLQKKIENGGSERVPMIPNKYADEWQKEQTFWFLKEIGWTFDEETKKWYKDGIKTKDGVFMKIKPYSKNYSKNVSKYVEKMRNYKEKHIEEVKYLRANGISTKLIADKFKVSTTTILTWLRESN